MKFATPLAFSMGVPNDVVPSKKVTVPVGVPPAVLVTVAVNVTAVSYTHLGLSDEVSAAADGLPLTTCVTGLEVLEL